MKRPSSARPECADYARQNNFLGDCPMEPPIIFLSTSCQKSIESINAFAMKQSRPPEMRSEKRSVQFIARRLPVAECVAINRP